jgi:hypothetical protein
VAPAEVRDARDGPCGVGKRDGDLLRLLPTTYAHRLLGIDGSLPRPRWYAFDRPWERRVYVVWDFGNRVTLSFAVRNGTVRADTTARLVFATLARLQVERWAQAKAS